MKKIVNCDKNDVIEILLQYLINLFSFAYRSSFSTLFHFRCVSSKYSEKTQRTVAVVSYWSPVLPTQTKALRKNSIRTN